MNKLSVIVLTLFCWACGPTTEWEWTPLHQEEAKVLDTIYIPGTSGHTNGSMGFSTSGDLVFTGGESVTTYDKYAIVFECQHGKFVIEDSGKGSRAHGLWMKLNRNDTCIVDYKMVNLITKYKDKPPTRQFVKFHFIDANRKQ